MLQKSLILKLVAFLAISIVFVFIEVFVRGIFLQNGIYLLNPGISWGLGGEFLKGSLGMYLPAILGLLLFTPYFIYKFPKGDSDSSLQIGGWLAIGSLVIIGALINLYDRLVYAAVVDYIPVTDSFYMNLSDLYILIGTVAFAGLIILQESHGRKSLKV